MMMLLILKNLIFLKDSDFKVSFGDIIIDEESGEIKNIIIHNDNNDDNNKYGSYDDYYCEKSNNNAGNSSDDSSNKVMDCKGMIAIPGLINAHIHLLDGNMKEIWLGLGIPELFYEGGVKDKRLAESSNDELLQSCVNGLKYAMESGTTVVASFVEESVKGLEISSRAQDLVGKGIHLIKLGRPHDPATNFTAEEIHKVLENSDGIALSSLNVSTDKDLSIVYNVCKEQQQQLDSEKQKQQQQLNNDNDKFVKKSPIVCTHMAEVKASGNFERCVKYYKPDFLVHCNYLSDEQLKVVARENIGIVCCIRSGKTFGADTIDLHKLVQNNITFAFGTDNLMTNTPDMFQELQYITRDLIIRHKGKLVVPAERILLGATRDAARLLGLNNTGLISEGYKADIVLLKQDGNLTPFHGAVSILLRASAKSVNYVIKNGKLFTTN